MLAYFVVNGYWISPVSRAFFLSVQRKPETQGGCGSFPHSLSRSDRAKLCSECATSLMPMFTNMHRSWILSLLTEQAESW